MDDVPFLPNARYPDPRIEVLDERFLKLRLFSATVERLFTGMRWAEGPVWFGDGRYLLVSDIPNNRILRWDEASGGVTEFRKPSNNANGHFRDRLAVDRRGGRLLGRGGGGEQAEPQNQPTAEGENWGHGEPPCS